MAMVMKNLTESSSISYNISAMGVLVNCNDKSNEESSTILSMISALIKLCFATKLLPNGVRILLL